MRRTILLINLIPILFFINCISPSHYTISANMDSSGKQNDTEMTSLINGKNKIMINSSNEEILGFTNFCKEKISSLMESYFAKILNDTYDKYNAGSWFSGNEKTRFYIDLKKFSSNNVKLVKYAVGEPYSYYKIKENLEFSISIYTANNPNYAALSLLYTISNQIWSSSLKNVNNDIGNHGFVSITDLRKPYKKYVRDIQVPNIIDDQDEVKKALTNAKGYNVESVVFFRDNVFCEITYSMGIHNPINDEYTIFDFAKEIDEFIQKQPTVDEFKPATLEFAFENYNIETYEWQKSKDYLQAAFINIESNDNAKLYEMLYEEALRNFGLIDDNDNLNDELLKKREKEFNEIYRSLEYPMRMKVSIADQLGNKGGVAEIAGIFKGQPSAKIPEPLTIENLEKIYDIETEKGIDEDKISWFVDEWSDFEDLNDENPNTKCFQLTDGRYIIVIDVTTSTNVKSRHFYELKVEHPRKSSNYTDEGESEKQLNNQKDDDNEEEEEKPEE